MKVYQELSNLINLYWHHREAQGVNSDAQYLVEDAIHALAKKYLPFGSGLDADMTVDVNRSTSYIIVIANADFHHMDQHGGYAGWTYHTITVQPTFAGSIDIHVSGRDRNRIKDYLREIFYNALSTEVVKP